MAETLHLEPDSAFINDMIACGGGDLKKCFQCATCTSVCELSNENLSFPRRLIVQAQWGLKEKVLADPAIWLCHDCGDCTAKCPRGAKPNEVVEALRAQAIKHFSFPRFAGTLVSQPKYLPLLLVIPFLVFRAFTLFQQTPGINRPFIFAELFPENFLEPLFFTVAGIVTFCFVVGVARYVKALRAAGNEGKILPGLVPTLTEILTHRQFAKCVTNHRRYWGHLLTLSGFAGLAVMGTAVGMATLAGIMHTPLPLLSGWKLFANFCATVILVGVTLLLIERFKTKEKLADMTYFESFFPLTLAAAVLTGILSEILRLTQTAELMYFVYFIHLTLVFMLFLYAPYSKFAHFVYRTIAMAAVRQPQSRSGAVLAYPANT